MCDIGKKHAGKPGMSGVWTNPLAGALRDAVPRRYGRRHVNTEALREAVSRRYRRRHVNTEAPLANGVMLLRFCPQINKR